MNPSSRLAFSLVVAACCSGCFLGNFPLRSYQIGLSPDDPIDWLVGEWQPVSDDAGECDAPPNWCFSTVKGGQFLLEVSDESYRVNAIRLEDESKGALLEVEVVLGNGVREGDIIPSLCIARMQDNALSITPLASESFIAVDLATAKFCGTRSREFVRKMSANQICDRECEAVRAGRDS